MWLGHVGTLRTFSEIGVSRSGTERRRKKQGIPVPRETMGVFLQRASPSGFEGAPLHPLESGAGAQAPWGALKVRKASSPG